MTSAYYSAPADSRIGFRAPSLVLGDDSNGLSPLQQHHGENILLSFWTSADAQSRLDDVRYDRLSRQLNNHYIHVSINLDRSVGVFNSVVTIDNLDRSTHYTVSPEVRDAVIKGWRLDGGFHSFLLDGEGKIIAVDPDEKTLSSL